MGGVDTVALHITQGRHTTDSEKPLPKAFQKHSNPGQHTDRKWGIIKEAMNISHTKKESISIEALKNRKQR